MIDTLVKTIPVIGAIVAILVSVIGLLRQRRVDKTTISGMIADSAKDWIKEYRERIEENEEEIRQQKILIISQQEQINMLTAKSNEQERRIANQQKQIDDLCEGAKALMTQVQDLGHEPVWKLPEKRGEGK